MTVLTETNIFRSDDLAIDFFSWGTSTHKNIAITFTPFGTDGAVSLDGAGYGGELLLRNDFDVVAFKSAKNLWYQNLSHETIVAVERFISTHTNRYIKRVGYGSSMGGYAAIQFSRSLKLDVVLALSPQFEIDKSYDQRWQGTAKLIDFQYRIDSSAIADDCKYFIAFDPGTEDVRHIEKLRELISEHQLVEIQTPFSGHPSAYYLAETGLIQDLALSVLKDGTVEHIAVGTHRKRSKTYLYELSKRLALQNKNKSALIAIDKAITIDVGTPEYHRHRSVVLSNLEQPEAALIAIDKAITIDSNVAALHLQRSMVLDSLDQTEAALGAAYDARRKMSNDPQLMGALSNRLAKHCDFDGALALIETAISIDENVLAFHLHRCAVCKALGDIPGEISAREFALKLAPASASFMARLSWLHARQRGLAHSTRSVVLATKAIFALFC